MYEIACVVGIGASSGGLNAFLDLLDHLPSCAGMAVIFVSHLEPDEIGALPTRLSRVTAMAVREARPRMLVEADHVYVVPPNASMVLASGRFKLNGAEGLEPRTSIDTLLRSIAADRHEAAIGVILSGDGSDGVLGLEAIKAEGGITFAEDPTTAAFPAMPRSAIASGSVDFVRTVPEIATELGVVAGRFRAAAQAASGLALGAGAGCDDDLQRVLAMLREARGVDFTLYRQSTLRRRLLRRMVLHKIQSVADYAYYLQDRPDEMEALSRDILIGVTRFFRDPEVFEALAERVFRPRIDAPVPVLARDARADAAEIRIWVPGCSTGEEAYSIAIVLLETLAQRGVTRSIQIFATDVSEAALDKARAGAYVENIAADVTPERLQRFFVHAGNEYRVSKAVRDLCVFARHDVTRDPPFSTLDLISCRNLLIYLVPALQKQVMPLFHYALKPSGALLLGASETVGSPSELFTLVDKRSKIHVKMSPRVRPTLAPSSGKRLHERARDVPAGGLVAPDALAGSSGFDIHKEADRLVMSRYAPAGVIIDSDLQILQFRGHTGPYLEPAPGEASLNVLKMARDGLLLELRAAIHKAKRTDAPVRTEGVQLCTGTGTGTGTRMEGALTEIIIEVVPLREARGDGASVAAERCFLVLFEDAHGMGGPREKARGAPGKKGPPKKGAELRAEKLEQELASTREYMQALIEEQDATNEELRSANDELLSSNEELQSINEELETAKEELQSTNGELTTLSDDLSSRNGELREVNDDLLNLLASVNIPIVMLSADMRIRRFTPQAEKVLNLIPSDIGRPIGDIKPKIESPDLDRLVAEVIETVAVRERDVQDRDGRWFSLRIRPYRTVENKIDGAVIYLVDVDAAKRAARDGGAPV